MRNELGQFISGYKNGFEDNLKIGQGWNKGTHITNSGSFKEGHRQSKISRIKMSIAKKGEPSQMKGKKHSLEARRKNRQSHLGNIPWNKGLGDITPENTRIRKSVNYKTWRKDCFTRDNYTCQVTGEYGGNLIVHHINNFTNFPKKRFDIKNGITMRKDIHDIFHKQYGYKNNTINQLLEFLENKKGVASLAFATP